MIERITIQLVEPLKNEMLHILLAEAKNQKLISELEKIYLDSPDFDRNAWGQELEDNVMEFFPEIEKKFHEAMALFLLAKRWNNFNYLPEPEKEMTEEMRQKAELWRQQKKQELREAYQILASFS